MKKGVAISYGDIALGAKESFVPQMDLVENFSDTSVLQKNNIDFPNYGNPIEKYSVLLDGSVLPFPSDVTNKNFGIWSSILSHEDGYFESPLTLSVTASELFTTSGITLTFDEGKNIYPIEVLVSWYRNGEKIVEDYFYPNSAEYFFNKKVEYYDKVEFNFLRLNLPQNRLKIHSITYGIGVVFYGDELKSAKVSQSISPISSELEINTFGFVLDSKRNIEYSFQTQQPITVYFNGEFLSEYFVKSSKRTSRKTWNVETEDYIGMMVSVPYYGGMYLNANADDIINDIFSVAKIPYVLGEEFVGVKVSGYMPYTDCREALMQICFAIGAVVTTEKTHGVKIFSLSQDVSQVLPRARVMQGQTSNVKQTVTAVELTAHSYSEIQEEMVAYEAEKNGIGENIFIKFNEPLHDLSITNGDLIYSNVNFAIINAFEGCVLSGKKYEHNTFTRTKRNPVVSSNDVENIVSISNATLISILNVDKISELCYNYIVNSQEIKAKIVEGKHTTRGDTIKYGAKKYGTFKYGEKEFITIFDKPVNLGDLIKIPLEFSQETTARATKQSFALLGGIIVKDTEMR